jgi:hypothetical protein
MSHRMLSVLLSLRHDLAHHLDRDAVLAHCRRLGHRWRACVLDPFAILQIFLVQVIHGNTALAHLPHLVGRCFTPSAFCQARARLPVAVFRAVLSGLGSGASREVDSVGRWHGHRTFLVDGSSFSMPDTPELQSRFGQSRKAKAGCGFPVAHLMVLFHAGTGLLREVFAAPLHSHDMGLVPALHPQMRDGDVLVGDRGFCSFAHIAALLERRLHAVFRIHQCQIVDFTPGRGHAAPGGSGPDAKGLPRSRWIRALGLTDQVVSWARPRKGPATIAPEAFAALPETITVRELRYRIDVPGYRTREVTIVTTLLDAELYPAEDLAALYFRRWEVETHLHELKQAMRMDVLRCETAEGVEKELLVYAIAYNLVRIVMLEASRRQGVPVDRISFTDALRWLAHARVGEELSDLIVNPHRPQRTEPRSIKRRPKQFPWMSAPRHEMRKRLLQQGNPA